MAGVIREPGAGRPVSPSPGGTTDHDAALPLVSVITPVFGVTDFLAEAIESVLAQSYPRVEHLVVDDGSPTPVAAPALTSAYPAVRWLRQPNMGPSGARNHGIRESGGEFLVFLDADDCLVPEAIQRGLDAIRAAPDIGMVFGVIEGMSASGETRGILRPGEEHIGPVSFEQLLARDVPGVPVGGLFRRAAVEAVGGFDEGLRGFEDYDLYVRMAKVTRIVGHGHLIARYRSHPAQSSRNLTMMMDARERIFARLALETQGQPRLHRALRQGRRWDGNYWQKSVLLQRISAHVSSGRYLRALEPMGILLWKHPRFFLENAGRKLRRLVRRTVPHPSGS